jgi:hypothetical protein
MEDKRQARETCHIGRWDVPAKKFPVLGWVDITWGKRDSQKQRLSSCFTPPWIEELISRTIRGTTTTAKAKQE